MNFLGHALLSGDDEELFIGNFCGDFVKGKQYKNYPERIAKGVLLHRAIDAYTDNHVATQHSRKKLAAKYRHYSGIIVDLYFDHFLACNWKNFHHLPLKEYSQGCYEILDRNFDIIPPGMQYVLPYMKKGNWLLHYAEIEGIRKALTGLSRRTRFENRMDEAHLTLEAHYIFFQHDFMTFMPAILSYIEDWKQKHLT